MFLENQSSYMKLNQLGLMGDHLLSLAQVNGAPGRLVEWNFWVKVIPCSHRCRRRREDNPPKSWVLLARFQHIQCSPHCGIHYLCLYNILQITFVRSLWFSSFWNELYILLWPCQSCLGTRVIRRSLPSGRPWQERPVMQCGRQLHSPW